MRPIIGLGIEDIAISLFFLWTMCGDISWRKCPVLPVSTAWDQWQVETGTIFGEVLGTFTWNPENGGATRALKSTGQNRTARFGVTIVRNSCAIIKNRDHKRLELSHNWKDLPSKERIDATWIIKTDDYRRHCQSKADFCERCNVYYEDHVTAVSEGGGAKREVWLHTEAGALQVWNLNPGNEQGNP